jgi:hypothetical protein
VYNEFVEKLKKSMDGVSVDSEMKNADCRKTTLFAEPFKSPANSQTNKENELKHRQTESDTFVRINKQTNRIIKDIFQIA